MIPKIIHYCWFGGKEIPDVYKRQGIGSAEYSKSNEMLTSTFYNQYGYLHYQYFTHAFVFIETGLLGLISYLMIFISSLKRGIKVLKLSLIHI